MERRVPRVALSRVGTAAALALTGLLLVLLLGDRAGRWVRDYVQGRPAYLQDFAAIELIPPPPAWIKPGREGLLAEIRQRSRHDPEESVLTRDLAGIGEDFLQSHWIRKVDRVERAYPNRLTVRLPPDGYREPVARLNRGPKAPAGPILDRDGNVLPEEEIDKAVAGKLIGIDGFEALRPVGLPGKLLRFEATPDGEPQLDPRLEPATRLAAFLKSRMAEGTPPFEPQSIRPVVGKGLWIWTTGEYYVIWGDATDPKKNAERWGRVREWMGTNTPPRKNSDQELDASGDRVVLVQIPLGSRQGSLQHNPSH